MRGRLRVESLAGCRGIRTDGKAVETVVTFCFIFQENERIGTIKLNNPGYAVIPTSPALGTEVFINEKIEHGCTNIEEK